MLIRYEHKVVKLFPVTPYDITKQTTSYATQIYNHVPNSQLKKNMMVSVQHSIRNCTTNNFITVHLRIVQTYRSAEAGSRCLPLLEGSLLRQILGVPL